MDWIRPSARDVSVTCVGGRLLHEGGAWRLVDASTSIEVRFRDATGASHEALAIVEGVRNGAILDAARVRQAQPPRAPADEWRRFSRTGLGARLALRAELLGEVRRYFANERFIEVDTPLRSAEAGTETHV